MQQHTFEVLQPPRENGVEIRQTSDPILNRNAWQNLSILMTDESTIFHHSADELKARWENSHAVCAVYQGEIISYLSLIPEYTEETRQRLSEQLNLRPDLLPGIYCYESATGWTDSAWRRKGINLIVRSYLYSQLKCANRLYYVTCRGLGAAPLLVKFGYRLVGWSAVPFFSSFGGWFEETRWYNRRFQMYETIPRHRPYNGDHLTGDAFSTHRWDDYMHFWVEDAAMAQHFDDQVCNLLRGDIDRWRDALQEL